MTDDLREHQRQQGRAQPAVLRAGERIAHLFKEKPLPCIGNRWLSDIDGKELVMTIGWEVSDGG